MVIPGINTAYRYRRSMPKAKIPISIDPDLLKWIEGEVKKKRFANRSHAIEFAVNELKKRG